MSSPKNRLDASGAVRRTFEWSTVFPSTAVIDTVAHAADSEPTDLPPLYGAIDPDALNDIVESGGPNITVSFVYDDRNITVHGQGDVVVRSE